MIFYGQETENEEKKQDASNIAMEKLLKYILPQKSIRLSPISKTNDPQESNGRNFQLGDDIDKYQDGNIDIGEFTKAQEEYKEVMKKDIKILCFAQDYIPGDNEAFIRDSGRGFAKPRMWAQYADNHQGVCLAFNKNKMIEYFNEKYNRYFYKYQPVRYKFEKYHNRRDCEAYTLLSSEFQEYNNDVKKIVFNRREKYYDMYYFFKHPDWQEEREYRFLLDYSKDTYPIIEIDGLLEGIILGERADEEMKKPREILTNIFENKPRIGKLIWNNMGYICVPIDN